MLAAFVRRNFKRKSGLQRSTFTALSGVVTNRLLAFDDCFVFLNLSPSKAGVIIYKNRGGVGKVAIYFVMLTGVS